VRHSISVKYCTDLQYAFKSAFRIKIKSAQFRRFKYFESERHTYLGGKTFSNGDQRGSIYTRSNQPHDMISISKEQHHAPPYRTLQTTWRDISKVLSSWLQCTQSKLTVGHLKLNLWEAKHAHSKFEVFFSAHERAREMRKGWRLHLDFTERSIVLNLCGGRVCI
jgi:hypothetical protein